MNSSRKPSVRAATREMVRERILAAAAELAGSGAWSSIRMVDIADRAGVSRRTVFNEFESKNGVLEAMAWRQMSRYLDGVAARLAEHSDDPVAAVTSTTEFVLSTVADDPLANTVLGAPLGTPDDLLSLLTTRSAPFVEAAAQLNIAFARQHWTNLVRPGVDIDFVAESLVRLLLSHMIRPSGSPAQTARSFGQLVQSLMIAEPPNAAGRQPTRKGSVNDDDS